jgi:uncharacterized protein (DUF433 family)
MVQGEYTWNTDRSACLSAATPETMPTTTPGEAPDAPTAYPHYPHIERRPDVLGGTPVIAGTRLPVWQIAAACTKGSSVDDLVGMYPVLTPAAAHSALAYYWDHKDDLDAEIQANQPEHVLRALRGDSKWLEERPGVFRLRVPFGSHAR